MADPGAQRGAGVASLDRWSHRLREAWAARAAKAILSAQRPPRSASKGRCEHYCSVASDKECRIPDAARGPPLENVAAASALHLAVLAGRPRADAGFIEMLRLRDPGAQWRAGEPQAAQRT